MKFFKTAFSALICIVLSFSADAQIGNPAPNFTVTDTHGNTHKLYDLLDSGKIVVLDFFFTTCIPCQFYTPQVNLAYKKYGCNTAEVFFMAIDYNNTNTEVLAYDQQYNIEYPSVSGLNGGGNSVVAQYGIIGFPTFYVIDSSKTIVQQIDPPTLQVFDFRFNQLGVAPADCAVSAAGETSTLKRLTLFPNPLSGNSINIQPPAGAAGSGVFEIFDGRGQIVRQGQIELNNARSLEIQVGDLFPGIFLLKISTQNKGNTYSGLFIKE